MVKKFSSMGSNTHAGINVDNIKNMGDAKFYDSTAQYVKVMGESYCENCKFENIKCMGESYFEKSELGNVKLMGETIIKNSHIRQLNSMGNVSVKETAKIDNLHLMGNLQADNLDCGILSIGAESDSFLGLFNFNKISIGSDVKLKGNISGETLESTLSLKLDGNFKFKNCIFLNSVKAANELECEAFYSMNKIELTDINSEYIFIRPFSCSIVNNIVGTKVMICRDFSVTDEFERIQKNYSNKVYENYNKDVGILEVDTIEADDIYIENVNANCVRGERIVIGKNCNIKRVEYSLELEVSKESKIGERIKEAK